MKVVLVRPPRFTKRPYFLSLQAPLNIAYLAAYLRRYYEVEIWDYEVDNYSESSFIQRLKRTRPSLIGFSCFTPSIINGHRMATAVKRASREIITVVGGVHVSSLPEQALLEFTNYDIAVIGEGEETLLELCQCIEKGKSVQGIKGLAYRMDGQIKIEKPRPLFDDLDSLPYPARDLLKMELYQGVVHKGFSRDYLRIVEVFTSRGCPYCCTFCASQATMGTRVRFRSIDNVFGEIEQCIREYNSNHVTLLDDTFTLRPQNVQTICRYLKQKGLTWNCTGTRVDAVSKELLEMMVQSGCRGIAFGVESGSPRILKAINKRTDIQQVKNAFKWAHQSGIKYVEADFIVGADPDETWEELALSQKLIREIRPDILSVSHIVPYPGTAVNKLMKERGYLSSADDWNAFTLFEERKPPWRTRYFTSKDLISIPRKLLRQYYFTPQWMYQQLRKIENIKEFGYWIRSGFSFLSRSIPGWLLPKVVEF